MEIKRVSCPKCGIVLDVSNNKNEVVKRFACPQCESHLMVRFNPPLYEKLHVKCPNCSTELRISFIKPAE